VLRTAVSDLYYNSWRFLGANVLFGAALIVVALSTLVSPWFLVLLPLAGLPAAGMLRMAAVLVRDGHADFGDVIDVVRRPVTALAVAAAQVGITFVLVIDMWIGAAIGSMAGLLLTVGAGYGLLIGWAYAAIAWPVLVDPERDGEPVRAKLRLAGLVLLAHPIRVGGFLVLVGAGLGLSAVAIAPFLTFTVALAWLVIARFVLPVADRIEGRRTLVADR